MDTTGSHIIPAWNSELGAETEPCVIQVHCLQASEEWLVYNLDVIYQLPFPCMHWDGHQESWVLQVFRCDKPLLFSGPLLLCSHHVWLSEGQGASGSWAKHLAHSCRQETSSGNPKGSVSLWCFAWRGVGQLEAKHQMQRKFQKSGGKGLFKEYS